MKLQGRIHEVYEKAIGDSLMAPGVIGDTAIVVGNGSTFSGYDGQAVGITDDTYTIYSTSDPNVYTVTPALVDNYEVGELVLMVPIIIDKRVKVMMNESGGEGGDLVDVALSHSLKPMLELGMRPQRSGEWVYMETISGRVTVTQVIQQNFGILGESVKSPIPHAFLSDGKVPEETATPEVIGGQNMFFVKSPWVDNTDPLLSRVYVSTDPGVTPDNDNLAGVVANGGVIGISSVNGVAIPIDTNTYFRLVSFDADGDGPDGPVAGPFQSYAGLSESDIFPIVSTDISPGAVNTPALAANSVTAAKVSTDIIVVNDVYTRGGVYITNGLGASVNINSSQGYRQTDSSGALRISLPIDPSPEAPYMFDGDLTARGFTALGYSSFRGTNNEISRNSTFTLARGTTSPTSAPSPSTGVWADAGPLVAKPADARGNAFWDGTGWIWLALGATLLDKPRMVRMTTAGVVTYTTLTGLPAASSDADAFMFAAGIVKIGTDFYAMLYKATGPNSFGIPYNIVVYRLTSSYALTSSLVVESGTNFVGYSTTAQISVDGSQIAVAKIHPSDSTLTRVQNYTAALASTGSPIDIAMPPGSSYTGRQNQAFLVGNFDFGSKRYIFQDMSSGYASSIFDVYNSSGAYQSSESFQVYSSDYISPDSIGWDGTRFYVWSYTNGVAPTYDPIARIPLKSDTRNSTLTCRAAFTWYDSDVAGTGTHETKIGPITTVTLPARAGAVKFTVPAPADDGTSDSPDSSRLYLGLTDSTLKLQGSPFVKTITVVSPNVSSGAAPPATNTFPDGVAARMQSSSGATYMSGDGSVRAVDFGAGPANQIAIDALGNGRVGPMNFTTTLSGFGTTTGNMGGTVLGQLGPGVSSTDAVNKGQLDTATKKVVCYRYMSFNNGGFATGTDYKVPYDTSVENVGGITYTDNGSGDRYFTIPVAGTYIIHATVRWNAAYTLIVNTITINNASGSRTVDSPVGLYGAVTHVGTLASGDQVRVLAQQQSGGGAVMTGDFGRDTSVKIVRISN